MAYKKVDESSLTQVANAIRNKAGTSAKLNFPTGFANAIAAIPTGGGGITPTGTITITENGTHYVANYENANVALPEVEQATPSISVSASGLITASVTQEAGVVPAGTETATKQLTTQSAKTVTPGTSNQTAVSSGRYTTGSVTVKGDANLVAGNIKKDVSIFGVTGNYEGASSGGIIPSGTLNISQNGTYSVYDYAQAKVNVQFSDPDLIPENIKAGVNILGVVGELVAGGGLPDGISAIDTGTFTPTSDVTNQITINHNLGVVPNFYFAFVEGGITDISAHAKEYVQSFGIKLPVGTNTFADVHINITSSGSLTQAAQSYGDAVYKMYFKDTSFRLALCGGTLKTGVTYRWVCGVME